MRIGELATRTGVSVRALRYYEEQQLLAARRTSGGQREYDEAAVERVRFIRQMFTAGLGSAAVRQILPCVHTGVATPEVLDRLAAERARLDRQIVDLTQTRDRLDGLMAAAVDRTQCPMAAPA